MSMQQDVLDTIGLEGIEKDHLRAKVGNIGQAELDGIVLQLQRAGRVRLAFGRYEVTGGPRAEKAITIADQHPTLTHSSPLPTAVWAFCGGGGGVTVLKKLIMHAYERGWLLFEMTERISRVLRRFRWFRHG